MWQLPQLNAFLDSNPQENQKRDLNREQQEPGFQLTNERTAICWPNRSLFVSGGNIKQPIEEHQFAFKFVLEKKIGKAQEKHIKIRNCLAFGYKKFKKRTSTLTTGTKYVNT